MSIVIGIFGLVGEIEEYRTRRLEFICLAYIFLVFELVTNVFYMLVVLF